MRQVRWRLGEELKVRSITPYRLAQALAPHISRNTVYALARGEPEGVQFKTLSAVMTELERISGNPVLLTDVLTIEEV